MKTVISSGSFQDAEVRAGSVSLRGDLTVPENALGIVLFAHGSGSGRKSSRNRYVASVLQQHGIGTLLFDLLTEDEERAEALTAHLRFDIPLLAERLIHVTDWLRTQESRHHAFGYFGASTGAAAALMAAAHFGDAIAAVVSRGGRPDLAGGKLSMVTAPTLLIVGSRDVPVIGLNKDAFTQLRCEKQMKIVEGATHLFEEPGTLETVAELAAGWFSKYFAAASGGRQTYRA
ncbi:MAG TPA: alpha/beta family hydrolase [Candidatus Kapabacteria bacterium]|nr:alpha/beta family hydrolase [Candidatus Kapabacteria bacterium]